MRFAQITFDHLRCQMVILANDIQVLIDKAYFIQGLHLRKGLLSSSTKLCLLKSKSCGLLPTRQLHPFYRDNTINMLVTHSH